MTGQGYGFANQPLEQNPSPGQDQGIHHIQQADRPSAGEYDGPGAGCGDVLDVPVGRPCDRQVSEELRDDVAVTDAADHWADHWRRRHDITAPRSR